LSKSSSFEYISFIPILLICATIIISSHIVHGKLYRCCMLLASSKSSILVSIFCSDVSPFKKDENNGIACSRFFHLRYTYLSYNKRRRIRYFTILSIIFLAFSPYFWSAAKWYTKTFASTKGISSPFLRTPLSLLSQHSLTLQHPIIPLTIIPLVLKVYPYS